MAESTATSLDTSAHVREVYKRPEPWVLRPDAQGRVDLPIGEYFGPLLVDCPMIVQGQGRATVIWNTHRPAVLVTSPGVHFENLYFDITFAEDGAHILYLEGCEPTLKNCFPEHVRVQPMSSEQHVIYLGKIFGGIPIEFPILLSTKVDWNRLASPFANGKFDKLPADRHKRRGFLIQVIPPNQDGYIIEAFTLEGPSSRAEWLLFAEVERKAAVSPARPVLLTPRGRKIYLPATGLEVSDRQLDFLLGKNGAVKEGLYGRFLAESKNWSFWTPYNPTDHITLDGRRINQYTRNTLLEGQKFSFGKAELTVGKADAPLILPDELRAKVVTINQTLSIPVELNAGFLSFGKSWVGEVVSLVPYLTVQNPQITLTRSQKRITVDVTINEHVKSLDDGLFYDRAGLVFANADDVMFVDLVLDVAIPRQSITVSPQWVVINPPNGLYAGEVQGATGEFMIRNDGREMVRLGIQTIDVLEIPPKAQRFDLPPSQEASIRVQFSALANQNIAEGKYQVDKAIHLLNDTGQVNMYIGVDAQIQASRRPMMALGIELPLSRHFNLSQTAPISFQLKVENMGAVPGDYQLQAPDFVSLNSSRSTLNGQSHHIITATITEAYLMQQAVGARLDIPFTLHGAKPGQPLEVFDQKTIVIEIVNHYPELIFHPNTWDIGAGIAGEAVEASQTVSVKNVGALEFFGRLVSTVDWLSVQPSSPIRIQPNETVKIRLDVEPRVKQLRPAIHASDAVLRATDDKRLLQQAPFSVKLRIDPAEPFVFPHHEILWFGALDQGTLTGKVGKIILGNYGHAPWKANVQALQNWLTIGQSQIEIPPGKIMTIPVMLNDQAERLPVGALWVAQAIQIQEHSPSNKGQKFVFPVFVMIKAPLPILEAGRNWIEMEDYSLGTDVNTPEIVPLANVGQLEWSKDATASRWPDWLRVEAPSYIPAGAKAQVKLFLVPERIPSDFNRLLEGEVTLVSAVQGGNTVELFVRVKVILPDVEIIPERLVLRPSYSVRPGYRDAGTTQTLTIHNRGESPFVLKPSTRRDVGNFIYYSWMRFSPPLHEMTIAPNSKVSFEVSLFAQEDSAFGSHPLILWVGDKKKFIDIVVEAP
jgi:hypothetical protein